MTKKKTESKTPILDDEDAGKSYEEVQRLWLQRQPEWYDGMLFQTAHEDIQNRYYNDRREQHEIRLMTAWDALSQDTRRTQIESYNNIVEALDKMMHVMYDLQRPIPESIRKIACKEFEW